MLYLVRDADVQHSYDVHKSITKEFFDSPEEYLMVKLFDPFEKSFSFSKNIFHYKTKFKHYCFWIHPKYEKFMDFKRVKDIVGDHVVMWRNEVATQSVRGIKHYQIYSFKTSSIAGCL